MTSFIDTHCHLDKLDLTPEEAVKQAKNEGVETMVTISVDEESFNFDSFFLQIHERIMHQFKNKKAAK